MPTCRDRQGCLSSERWEKSWTILLAPACSDAAASGRRRCTKQKGLRGFPRSPLAGVQLLSFSYYGPNENGQGDDCTKFLLLLASSKAVFIDSSHARFGLPECVSRCNSRHMVPRV